MSFKLMDFNYFKGINFRELNFTKAFARIIFCELDSTKNFAEINFAFALRKFFLLPQFMVLRMISTKTNTFLLKKMTE